MLAGGIYHRPLKRVPLPRRRVLQQLDGSLSDHDDDGKIAMKERNLRQPETLGVKHVIALGKAKT